MFHQKWPTPPFSRKLRKILDRSLTPDPNKDNEHTEIPTETTAQTSSSAPHQPTTHFFQEHSSLAEANSQAAFSHALSHEFNDFFFFACNKTVSGENVLFLRLVQCWKACWSLISLDTDKTNQQRADSEGLLRRKVFSVAVEMYYDFINPSTACKLLLNIEDGLAGALESVLGDAAMTISTGTEHEPAVVAPFITPDTQEDMTDYRDLLGMWWDLVSSADETSNNSNKDHLHEKPLPALPANTATATHSFRLLKMEFRVSQTAAIPETFCKEIFDTVESSVYQMVLRDTFPKYVSWRKLKDAESGNFTRAGGKLL